MKWNSRSCTQLKSLWVNILSCLVTFFIVISKDAFIFFCIILHMFGWYVCVYIIPLTKKIPNYCIFTVMLCSFKISSPLWTFLPESCQKFSLAMVDWTMKTTTPMIPYLCLNVFVSTSIHNVTGVDCFPMNSCWKPWCLQSHLLVAKDNSRMKEENRKKREKREGGMMKNREGRCCCPPGVQADRFTWRGQKVLQRRGTQQRLMEGVRFFSTWQTPTWTSIIGSTPPGSQSSSEERSWDQPLGWWHRILRIFLTWSLLSLL